MILEPASIINLQRIAGRKIRRRSITGDKNIAAVAGNAATLVRQISSEKRRIDQPRTCGVQLRYESIQRCASKRSLNCITDRKVGRGGIAGYASIARIIERNRPSPVHIRTSSQIGRIHEGRTFGIDL